MIKRLVLSTIALLLYACNADQNSESTYNATSQDSLAPIQINILADLPDSLQPHRIVIDSMPPPAYHLIENELRTDLAVLRNNEGQARLDFSGNPFIMGHGGLSDFSSFTSENGLALDALGSSMMDRAGNLWFGTFGGGVSRYNGKSFTNFTNSHGLSNNAILVLLEDHSGNFWFGNYGTGVCYYDGKTFTTISTEQGLAHSIVTSLFQDKSGSIWIGTEGGGVSRLNPKDLPKKTAQHLFTNFSTEQGLAGDIVISILEDKTGKLWFGTDEGVSCYDGKTFTNFYEEDGLPDNYTSQILEDRSGNLWFGTNNGLSCYNGESFTNFSLEHGLISNSVICIAEDKQGVLWFGTSEGVSYYAPLHLIL